MVTILDGGMGGELIRRGVASRTGLWSVRPLIENPDAVVRAHRDYIAAGARIITTNSYSTIPSYLCKEGLESRYVELTALSGELARRAARESGVDGVRVAGCLPPLSESYRPDLVPPDDEARPIYAEMARALAPNVDLFLCETMSSAREARNAALAARAAGRARGLPVFVSWTLHETVGATLRSGEPIGRALEAVADLAIDAFLCNCTTREAIAEGMTTLAKLTDKPFGGYPNRMHVPDGWTLDNEAEVEHHNELCTEAFVAGALEAFANGASFYGGCCGVGPEDIAALAAAVPELAA